MRIGILTQPLYFNYGGILQAFALQKVLNSLEHEAYIINRIDTPQINVIYSSLSRLKKIFQNILLFITGKVSIDELNISLLNINASTFTFVKKYMSPIPQTITDDIHLRKYVNKMHFDAYVVGSDQVWRPKYSPDIYTYFLNFVPDNIIKLAYGASFGVDNWEFTDAQTEVCRTLLSRFNAVSVRESTGVMLCEKYLDRHDVQQVLDPTMLLFVSDYDNIIKDMDLSMASSMYLVTYILDNTNSINNILHSVSSKLGYAIIDAKYGYKHFKQDHIDNRASVKEWLYAFRNASFAVVDSFHGCVFSILFHIPFIVIGNRERGLARISSLLSLFELNHRLIISEQEINEDLLNYQFNWEQVDIVLKRYKAQSLNFIKNNLQ